MSKHGLQFFDLTQRIGHNMPQWPSVASTVLTVNRLRYHAMHEETVQEYDGIMHRGTHMDAPVHVLANQPYITDYPLWRFFGTGVAVSIPKGRWGVITPDDLERATPTIEPNDIVMINTGSHHDWGDNAEYFLYGPGLYKDAAEWLVERKVKLVGVDVQALDHPLGTKLIAHGTGPSHPELMEEYKAQTGRDVMDDFPLWEPAHKTMLLAGIPGIESVGGELDAVTGKRCTFIAFPWRYPTGEASALRVAAVLDPDRRFRIPGGP